MSYRISKMKSRQQIAVEYGVCPKTFSRLLRENGISLPKGLISPKDQNRIYNLLGQPERE